MNDIPPPPSHGTRVRCTFFPRNKLDPGVGGGGGGVGWGGRWDGKLDPGAGYPRGRGRRTTTSPSPTRAWERNHPYPPSPPPTTGALFKRSPFSPCQVIRAPDLFTSSSSPSPLRVSMVRVGGWVGGWVGTLSFFF